MALQSAGKGSLCFASLTYDDETQTISMTFQDGASYQIENFPATEWSRWRSAASLGQYFNRNVRGKY